MTDESFPEAIFEAERPRLLSMAIRFVGDRATAEDIVQTAWIRVADSDSSAVEKPEALLTTVVSRLAIDHLRRRSTKDVQTGDISSFEELHLDHSLEDEVIKADEVSQALLVVLDALHPAERLAFVLHDVFAVPFEQIGIILGRSTSASKQLASRARARVQGGNKNSLRDEARSREIVDAFLVAAKGGDMTGLVTLLHPDIVMTADKAALAMGATATAGPTEVASVFSGRALGAEVVLIDGSPSLAWIVNGNLKVVWEFVFGEDGIAQIDMLASSDLLETLHVERLTSGD